MNQQVSEADFINHLIEGVDEAIINQIQNKTTSPLKYAFKVIRDRMTEGNDINHSFRVFYNCKCIISKCVAKKISTNDILILFYTSLLHDIAKTENLSIKRDIVSATKQKCYLLSDDAADHGIRAAYYIGEKMEQRKIKFYGLNSLDVKKMQSIISFHNSGRIYRHFSSGRGTQKDLLLHFIFFVADIADAFDRVRGSGTVNAKYQDTRTKGRKGIIRVEIREHTILWRIRRATNAFRKIIQRENRKLAEKRTMLQALGLPYEIVFKEKNPVKECKNLTTQTTDYNSIALTGANLSLNVARCPSPIIISGDTINEVYEKIVEAFSENSVTTKLSYKNYFGPLTIEIRNSRHVGEDDIHVRSEVVKRIRDIENYTTKWLNAEEGAEEDFYFGYTHGQRIYRYFYPSTGDQIEKLLNATQSTDEEIKKDRLIKTIQGIIKDDKQIMIDQFDHIIKLLKKEKRNTRRAYLLIPNLLIDNPKSRFFIREEMSPSLIVFQFFIEKDYSLSGFALLRCQELSTFFLVNYFEMKYLIQKIIRRIRGQIKGIKPGRIVMQTACGYFGPSVPLLEKPDICRESELTYQKYACQLYKSKIRTDFINKLEQYKGDYIRIDINWCNRIMDHIDRSSIKRKKVVSSAFTTVRNKLMVLEIERGKGGHSMMNGLRQRKIKAIDEFVNKIKAIYND